MKLVILRPQPEAAATAARAADAGCEAVISPLFEGHALDWTAPDPAEFDAVLFTSANAARYGGPKLARYRCLPVHAVGEATAAAARKAGFDDVVAGPGDVASLLLAIAAGPHRRLLHLCGAHRQSRCAGSLKVHEVPVYEMVAAARLSPEAEAALHSGAVAMVHSPRAASRIGDLVDNAAIHRAGISLVAISDACAQAAGTGWRGVMAASPPTDAAMLAIARSICDKPPS